MPAPGHAARTCTSPRTRRSRGWRRQSRCCLHLGCASSRSLPRTRSSLQSPAELRMVVRAAPAVRSELGSLPDGRRAGLRALCCSSVIPTINGSTRRLQSPPLVYLHATASATQRSGSWCRASNEWPSSSLRPRVSTDKKSHTTLETWITHRFDCPTGRNRAGILNYLLSAPASQRGGATSTYMTAVSIPKKATRETDRPLLVSSLRLHHQILHSVATTATPPNQYHHPDLTRSAPSTKTSAAAIVLSGININEAPSLYVPKRARHAISNQTARIMDIPARTFSPLSKV